MIYETADWQFPTTMAKALLKRHRDVSTVRAMVLNEFGRAPDLDDLRKMQKRMDQSDEYLSRRFASVGFDAHAVASIEEHERSMTYGSQALARAIERARGAL